MAKFLALWHFNPNSPMPTDSTEMVKAADMMWAATDYLLKTGELLEFGFFPNGRSGYAIGTGEAKDEFRRAFSFYPFVEGEVYEMIPYETGKEIMMGVIKAQAEQMKAMK
jgi:hypothetical protein